MEQTEYVTTNGRRAKLMRDDSPLLRDVCFAGVRCVDRRGNALVEEFTADELRALADAMERADSAVITFDDGSRYAGRASS